MKEMVEEELWDAFNQGTNMKTTQYKNLLPYKVAEQLKFA